MKLLHIDAGITGPDSVSRQLSAAIADALIRGNPDLEVVHRDLDADAIPHLDSGALATLGDNAILQEFLDADILVIGAPMYNFGMASQLKAWFDRIVVAGRTFRYTETGVEGLAGGKTVIIASARGGVYAPGTPHAGIDFHEPHLKTLFGMVGISDVTIIRAEGVALSPDHRAAALQEALAATPDVVANLVPAVAA
jgi:FMN-dependent NADH-azoreductase